MPEASAMGGSVDHGDFVQAEPPRKLSASSWCQDMRPNNAVTGREEECAWGGGRGRAWPLAPCTQKSHLLMGSTEIATKLTILEG